MLCFRWAAEPASARGSDRDHLSKERLGAGQRGSGLPPHSYRGQPLSQMSPPPPSSLHPEPPPLTVPYTHPLFISPPSDWDLQTGSLLHLYVLNWTTRTSSRRDLTRLCVWFLSCLLLLQLVRFVCWRLFWVHVESRPGLRLSAEPRCFAGLSLSGLWDQERRVLLDWNIWLFGSRGEQEEEWL